MRTFLLAILSMIVIAAGLAGYAIYDSEPDYMLYAGYTAGATVGIAATTFAFILVLRILRRTKFLVKSAMTRVRNLTKTFQARSINVTFLKSSTFKSLFISIPILLVITTIFTAILRLKPAHGDESKLLLTSQSTDRTTSDFLFQSSQTPVPVIKQQAKSTTQQNQSIASIFADLKFIAPNSWQMHVTMGQNDIANGLTEQACARVTSLELLLQAHVTQALHDKVSCLKKICGGNKCTVDSSAPVREVSEVLISNLSERLTYHGNPSPGDDSTLRNSLLGTADSSGQALQICYALKLVGIPDVIQAADALIDHIENNYPLSQVPTTSQLRHASFQLSQAFALDEIVEKVAISPNGGVVAAVNDTRLVGWDTQSGTQVFSSKSYGSHQLQFDPNNKFIITAGVHDSEELARTLHVWDISGKPVHSVHAECYAATWSDSGQYIYGGGTTFSPWRLNALNWSLISTKPHSLPDADAILNCYPMGESSYACVSMRGKVFVVHFENGEANITPIPLDGYALGVIGFTAKHIAVLTDSYAYDVILPLSGLTPLQISKYELFKADEGHSVSSFAVSGDKRVFALGCSGYIILGKMVGGKARPAVLQNIRDLIPSDNYSGPKLTGQEVWSLSFTSDGSALAFSGRNASSVYVMQVKF